MLVDQYHDRHRPAGAWVLVVVAVKIMSSLIIFIPDCHSTPSRDY